MDYELWCRFFLEGAEFRNTGVPFGMFRQQPDQKTKDRIATTNSMVDSSLKLLDLARDVPGETREAHRADLLAYRAEYPDLVWRNSGRLARMGVPRPIGMRIRRLKARLAGLIPGKA